jgi:hypothetical protein
MKKLKPIGLWIVKWIISPPLIILAIIPILLGIVIGAFWTAFKSGWNLM